MIDVHQNVTLSEPFEGDRSRIIGNRCKFRVYSKLLGIYSTVSYYN